MKRLVNGIHGRANGDDDNLYCSDYDVSIFLANSRSKLKAFPDELF